MLQSNGSNHKVLFQNAEGSINMGFLFDDPRNGLADKHWMQLLGMLIESSIENKDGIVSVDGEFKTKSCYAELHRKSERNFYL